MAKFFIQISDLALEYILWIFASLISPTTGYMHRWIGPALVQIMSFHLFGAKTLSKVMLKFVNWTFRNTLQWNFNQNTKHLSHENPFENIVCEMAGVVVVVVVVVVLKVVVVLVVMVVVGGWGGVDVTKKHRLWRYSQWKNAKCFYTNFAATSTAGWCHIKCMCIIFILHNTRCGILSARSETRY